MSVGAIYMAYRGLTRPYVTSRDNQKLLTDDYISAGLHSLKSLRKVSDIPVTVFTDSPKIFESYDCDIIESGPTYGDTKDKLFVYQATPYETTLFLDCDTEVLRDPYDIIDTDCEMQLCRELFLDIKRKEWLGFHYNYNTGVFVYTQTLSMERVWEKCIVAAESLPIGVNSGDQNIVNKQIRGPGGLCVNVKLMPNTWNVRAGIYSQVEEKNILHLHNLHNENRELVIEEAMKWEPAVKKYLKADLACQA